MRKDRQKDILVLGMLYLGPGEDSGAAQVGATGMRTPTDRAGPFRPTKAGINRETHNSMKGSAGTIGEQSRITLLRGN